MYLRVQIADTNAACAETSQFHIARVHFRRVRLSVFWQVANASHIFTIGVQYFFSICLDRLTREQIVDEVKAKTDEKHKHMSV